MHASHNTEKGTTCSYFETQFGKYTTTHIRMNALRNTGKRFSINQSEKTKNISL